MQTLISLASALYTKLFSTAVQVQPLAFECKCWEW